MKSVSCESQTKHSWPWELTVALGASAAAILVLCSAALVCVQKVSQVTSLPSDSELIDVFEDHESQFAQVIGDLEASEGVDPERLRELRVEPDGVRQVNKHLTLLYVRSIGLVPSGFAKGFAYSERPLTKTTDADLEEYGGDTEYSPVYRHIKGPWYLFYEAW